jgi:hypothetical protein
MGLFSGVENEKPSEGGVYFEPGQYVWRIDACKQGKNRHGIGFAVVEGTILKSTNPERPPGMKCSWMQMKGKEGWLGRVRGFAMEASGADLEEVDEAAVEAIFSDENPLDGVIVNVDAFTTETKAKAKITGVKFARMSEAEQAKWQKTAA